jgi:hypothetical protein
MTDAIAASLFTPRMVDGPSARRYSKQVKLIAAAACVLTFACGATASAPPPRRDPTPDVEAPPRAADVRDLDGDRFADLIDAARTLDDRRDQE